VGWGQINETPLRPGDIGQSLTNQTDVPYSTLLSALQHDAESPDDARAVASLPASSPTATNFVMSRAEVKSLGLLPVVAAGIDGWVGFNSSVLYSFDPNNRAVPGEYDFFAVASHEISEVMGRYGFGQNGSGGADSPIDLFRYASPTNRQLSPTFSGSNYFSIDGGTTVINTFNTTCCGDLSDWSGQSPDTYNAFLTTGQVLPTSAGDLRVMDVLGYDISTLTEPGTPFSTVPEPSTLVLVSVGLAGLFTVKFLLKSATEKTRSF
jgi:PEP-CTERM motif-containing protein